MRLALTVFGHTLTIDTRIDCGHKWDSDRPSGPLHHRDICWRCDRTRP